MADRSFFSEYEEELEQLRQRLTLGARLVYGRLHDRHHADGKISNALLLACKVDDGKWVYNPPLEMELMPGYTLIVMGSPEDVTSLRAALTEPGELLLPENQIPVPSLA